MSKKQSKQVAIITGGAHGIGLATSRLLLENDYQVGIWDANEQAVNRLPDELSGHLENYIGLVCDVSEGKAIQQAFRQTLDRFGRLDLLVNNAGIMDHKPLNEVTLSDWNRVLATNLTAAFLGAKYAAAELAKNKGSIINMASTRAFQSEPDTFSYSASKGALVALTHSLAMSLGPDIRVNCISPGWIDVTGEPEKLRPEDHAQHPVGRVGKPEDIARMVLFLADKANDFITGQNFTLDGGMTKKMVYVE